MVVHTKEKNYQCSECGKAFGRKADLKKHMVIHMGEKNYVCSESGKAFGLKEYLTSHMVVHTGVRRFKCTICLFLQIKSHIPYAGPHYRPYKCFCRQSFRSGSISALKRHGRKHLSEKLRCPFEGCDKKYVTISGLRHHLQYCSYSQATMTNA